MDDVPPIRALHSGMLGNGWCRRLSLQLDGVALGVATVTFAGPHWSISAHQEIDGSQSHTRSLGHPFLVNRHDALRWSHRTGASLYVAIVDSFRQANDNWASAPDCGVLAIYYHVVMECGQKESIGDLGGLSGFDIAPAQRWLQSHAPITVPDARWTPALIVNLDE